jgi:hypothetical protein
MSGSTRDDLSAIFEELGIDLERDCRVIPAIRCYDSENDLKSCAFCSVSIQKEVREYKPKLIICMGNEATRATYVHDYGKAIGELEMWRGFVIPARKYNAYMVSCWGIEHFNMMAEKKPRSKSLYKKIMIADIHAAIMQMDEPFPVPDEDRCTHVLNEQESIGFLTREIKNPAKFLALDYETTGLKPYDPGHHIVCASFCNAWDYSVSFMLTEKNTPLIQKVLQNSSRKIFTNVKYEDTWSVICLGTEIKNPIWDTMQCMHMIDNRPDITSLKFSAYVTYGLAPYDAEMKQYLKADKALVEKHGANAINNIDKAPIKPMLKYCSTDSLMSYRVAMWQMKGITK